MFLFALSLLKPGFSGFSRHATRTFSEKNRTQTAVEIKRLKRTGSVADASRFEKRKMATDEGA